MEDTNLKSTMSRLIITEEQQKQLDAALETLLDQAQGRSVMLIERSGILLSSFGNEIANNIAISSLIAGIFKSITALSAFLGESETKTLQHRGSTSNMVMTLLESGDILAVQIPNPTTHDYEAPIEEAIGLVAPILVAARDSTKKSTPYFGKDSISLILGKLS